MTEKTRKNWQREYIDLLSQAAGTAYILGYKDAAAVLHRLSVDAMGLATKRARKVIDNAAKKRYTESKSGQTARNEEGKTMTIYGRAITNADMRNIADYMDDTIREELHNKLAPCSNEEFLREYIKRDPDIMDILRSEFDYKD